MSEMTFQSRVARRFFPLIVVSAEIYIVVFKGLYACEASHDRLAAHCA